MAGGRRKRNSFKDKRLPAISSRARRSTSRRIRYSSCGGTPNCACCEVIGCPLPVLQRGVTASIPLQEIRTDVGFLLDRIVIAIDAVGNERVARNDGVLVELHRTQSDHRSSRPAIPFERGGTLRFFTGRNRVREHIAFDEGFHGP